MGREDGYGPAAGGSDTVRIKMDMRRKRWIRFGVPAVLILVSVLGILAARNTDGFADWYGEMVYPKIVGTVGKFLGIFPVSVVEIGLYLLIILAVWYILSHIRQTARIAAAALWCVAILLFLYVFNCGINYSRTPFSRIAGLEIRESTEEELYQLCSYLTDQVGDSCRELESGGRADGVWGTGKLSYGEALELGKEGVSAMKKLGETYPSLAVSYPAPKPVLISGILSVQQLSGIYSPFTVEANFNRDMTPYNIPHTVCHELSHLSGFMREDEANFIGYLACVGSDSPEYRYSGYLMGWIYAANALYREDPEAYFELAGQLPEGTRAALAANSAFWDRFEGKIAEAANQINDTYLKINRQADGVKSYGRVVDLMLSYYRFSL